MAILPIQPKDLLEYFELESFTRRWEKLELPDEELGNLQIQIMADPKRHPVVKGTHGLRKMRYSPLSWQTGKSGALRVCYVHFDRLFTVLLVIVYAKNEMDGIPENLKPALNQAIDDIEQALLAKREQEHGKAGTRPKHR